jgi:nitrite reductase/ring-hydroxylating ferredoxin subunit
MEIVIGSAKTLPPGKMMGIEINGKNILLANYQGKYYAIGNICTHEGCSLSDGTLKEEKVECPCHNSTFDIRTGVVIKGPAMGPEPVFELKLEQDQIIANL